MWTNKFYNNFLFPFFTSSFITIIIIRNLRYWTKLVQHFFPYIRITNYEQMCSGRAILLISSTLSVASSLIVAIYVLYVVSSSAMKEILLDHSAMAINELCFSIVVYPKTGLIKHYPQNKQFPPNQPFFPSCISFRSRNLHLISYYNEWQ